MFGGLGGLAGGIVNYGVSFTTTVKDTEKLGKLRKGIQGLQKRFISFGVTTIFIDRLIQSLTRAWGALNTVLGVDRITKNSERILRLAQASGVGVAKLQGLAGAVGLVGGELNDVADLFQTLAERVDDLRSGEKGISEDFLRFGITRSTFAGATDSMEMFLRMMRELDKLDPSKRMAALEKILGGDLARKFGQLGDVKQILAAMKEAKDTGQVLTEQQLQQAAAFASTRRRLSRLFTAISSSIGLAFLPALERFAAVMSPLLVDLATFLKNNIPQISGQILAFFNGITEFVANIISGMDSIRPVGEYLTRMATGLSLAVTAMSVLSQGPLLGFFVAMARTAEFMGNAVDDFLTFMRGGVSFMGGMLRQSAALRVFWGGLVHLWLQLKETAAWLVDALSILGEGYVMDGLLAALGVVLVLIGETIKTTAMLAYVLAVVADFLASIAASALDLAGTVIYWLGSAALGGGFAAGTAATAAAFGPNWYRSAPLAGQGELTNMEKLALSMSGGDYNTNNRSTFYINSSQPGAVASQIQSGIAVKSAYTKP